MSPVMGNKVKIWAPIHGVSSHKLKGLQRVEEAAAMTHAEPQQNI